MTPFPILFEDGEALVIDKPAGLPLDRPRAGGRCMEDFLDDLRLGFQRRPLPVHRLDQDTSGCLLLARNPKAHKRFAAAFEARLVDKVYLGIVAGPLDQDAGTIELSLSKISSAEAGWRMIPAKKGKPSVTHWRKLAEHRRPYAGRIQARNRADAPDPHPCLGRAGPCPAGRSDLWYRAGRAADHAPCRSTDRAARRKARDCREGAAAR